MKTAGPRSILPTKGAHALALALVAGAATIATTAGAQQPAWIGGHVEIGVLPTASGILGGPLGGTRTYTLDLGPDFRVYQDGPFYVGAGPSLLVGLHYDCGSHCAHELVMAGLNGEVGAALGPLFAGARVDALAGYTAGYAYGGYGVWILPSIMLGVRIRDAAALGPYAGTLFAPGGLAAPTGFVAGLRFTSLF